MQGTAMPFPVSSKPYSSNYVYYDPNIDDADEESDDDQNIGQHNFQSQIEIINSSFQEMKDELKAIICKQELRIKEIENNIREDNLRIKKIEDNLCEDNLRIKEKIEAQSEKDRLDQLLLDELKSKIMDHEKLINKIEEELKQKPIEQPLVTVGAIKVEQKQSTEEKKQLIVSLGKQKIGLPISTIKKILLCMFTFFPNIFKAFTSQWNRNHRITILHRNK